MDPTAYFIETLSLRVWATTVWPRLIRNKLSHGRGPISCYVIDGSRRAMVIAKASAWMVGVSIERLEFTYEDVCDDQGLQIFLRVSYQDLAQVRSEVIAEPAFQETVNGSLRGDRLSMFLAKSLAKIDLLEKNSMYRALMVVQVCVWTTQHGDHRGEVPVLFMNRRPWNHVIMRYAAKWGVDVVPVEPIISLRKLVRRRLSSRMLSVLRILRLRIARRDLWLFKRASVPLSPVKTGNGTANDFEELKRPWKQLEARVVVPYFGHFNLNRPELYSDLFFWQRSTLSGSDVLLAFASPRDQLDELKLAELREHRMAAVALHPGATTVAAAPVFKHTHRRNGAQRRERSAVGKTPEEQWLNELANEYQTSRSYWHDLFDTYDAKVFLSWFKYDATDCSIADAMQARGGVTAIYQRAYESHPTAETTMDVDIVFGFSSAVAEVERLSGSVIRYHVTTGYPGDHRFQLLELRAKELRNTLQQNGAKRILAYFDENPQADARWFISNKINQENHAFLLQKVLDESWLGLVLKPKRPSTWRRRLGPVADLLQRAESTGRCFVYEEGVVQGSYPPAVAALASDIAIHGHLFAATAALEAALAGVPTLLLDREGWPVSPLYQLGVGQVVFTEWDGLWKSLKSHWSTPGGIPGLGDWSPLMDELDPFRDGRAAERIGTYIKWLLEGFQDGLDRETVMGDAAERYCSLWGADKITEINGTMGVALDLPRSIQSRQGPSS